MPSMPPEPQAFSMPMYKEWFPRRLRPWCYMLMILIFQLSSGIYLGNIALMVGERGLMSADAMCIGMCTIVGVTMPFPFLFKFKFHFSNNRLLLLATSMMLLTTIACMYVRSVPLLCVLAFVEGFFKPCGTFECFSNIQLWLTRTRDMRIFFPILYFFIAGTMSLQAWLAVNIAYNYDSWQMMHWLVAGLLTLCLIFQTSCLKKFYILRLPFKSLDWLGLLLWSAFFCGLVWLFCYGEYYNYAQSRIWRDGCVIVGVVLLITIGRMLNIRHPFISPAIFKVRGLYPILLTFTFGEWFSSTPKVLGSTYIGAMMHWGAFQASILDLYVWMGVVCGSLFAFVWMKVWHLSFQKLGIVGFSSLLLYQLIMYFILSPATTIEMLRMPMFLRGVGYDIILIVATIQLFEVFDIQLFFMAVAFTGIVRNGPVDCLVASVYEFFLRRQSAAALSMGDVTTSYDALLVALKQIFGATCLIGSAFLLLYLLFDTQAMRTLSRQPSWFYVLRHLHRRSQVSN